MNIINDDDDECPICFEDIINKTTLKCGHRFCTNCILLYSITSFNENKLEVNCPICRSIVIVIKDELDYLEKKKTKFLDRTILITISLMILIVILRNVYIVFKDEN
jgi:preprotein translocase subunit SecG